jgi:hypothetical protein
MPDFALPYFLALAALLVGACNHELTPPPLPPGTGSDAGGAGAGRGTGGSSAGSGTGGDGFGGQGGNTSCFTGDSCVQSCSEYFPGGGVSGYCDATGAFACPGQTVRLSTCAPNACAQFTSNCCDDITGAHGQPPCGPDGLKQACPAGSHPYDYRIGCIPTGLGVTQCLDLEGKACDLQSQSCTQGDAFCDCAPATTDGGALTWRCAILI